MDIISHGLWGIGIIDKKIKPWWSFLSGALPDLISSGFGFIYLLFWQNVLWSTTTWSLLPNWIQALYQYSHSLLGALVFLLAILIFGWPKILIWPYLFHIILDVFTHTGDPINRLLFPSRINSDFFIQSNWWENFWLILINWLVIVIYFSWRLQTKIKKSPLITIK